MSLEGNATLWYWMNERHRIYLLRSAGLPAPWTEDPILRQYRFCNLFRELDTVTVWIREHIREPFADSPHLWFALCAARIFNWPETLRAILCAHALPVEPEDVYNPEALYAVLNELRLAGRKRYTSAYMLRGPAADKGWDRDGLNNKDWYYAQGVLGALWKYKRITFEHLARSTELWTVELASSMGFGRFMAYEVVCDLHHTRVLAGAPDRNTWANAGPGAIRGLNRIAGRELRFPLRKAVALIEMRELLAVANGSDSPLEPHVPRPLELRDIEHSLCETDKYLRVKLGEGRPRETFAGDVA